MPSVRDRPFSALERPCCARSARGARRARSRRGSARTVLAPVNEFAFQNDPHERIVHPRQNGTRCYLVFHRDTEAALTSIVHLGRFGTRGRRGAAWAVARACAGDGSLGSTGWPLARIPPRARATRASAGAPRARGPLEAGSGKRRVYRGRDRSAPKLGKDDGPDLGLRGVTPAQGVPTSKNLRTPPPGLQPAREIRGWGHTGRATSRSRGLAPQNGVPSIRENHPGTSSGRASRPKIALAATLPAPRRARASTAFTVPASPPPENLSRLLGFTPTPA